MLTVTCIQSAHFDVNICWSSTYFLQSWFPSCMLACSLLNTEKFSIGACFTTKGERNVAVQNCHVREVEHELPVHFHVQQLIVCLQFCLLCPHSPRVCCNSPLQLASGLFNSHHRSFLLLVGCAC